MFDDLPAERLPEIGTKYAKQAHVNSLTAFWYLPMNVNLAPFNNPKARQAVNWAVDRAAIVKLFGGSNVAQPVCTFLPPGFPGHEDNCQYTNPAGTTWKGPDLAKAKQLVQSQARPGRRCRQPTVGQGRPGRDVGRRGRPADHPEEDRLHRSAGRGRRQGDAHHPGQHDRPRAR